MRFILCYSNYLRLDHGRPLRSQNPGRLEHIDHALILHPLQDDAQGDEDASSTNASTEKGQQLSIDFQHQSLLKTITCSAQ